MTQGGCELTSRAESVSAGNVGEGWKALPLATIYSDVITTYDATPHHTINSSKCLTQVAVITRHYLDVIQWHASHPTSEPVAPNCMKRHPCARNLSMYSVHLVSLNYTDSPTHLYICLGTSRNTHPTSIFHHKSQRLAFIAIFQFPFFSFVLDRGLGFSVKAFRQILV